MWSKIERPKLADYSAEEIRQYSIRHLAEIFGMPEASLSTDDRFGQELKAVPASCFGKNEFDVIDSEIKDVSDKYLLKKMAKGLLIIQTVGDYCEHMIHCSHIKPEEVSFILKLPGGRKN